MSVLATKARLGPSPALSNSFAARKKINMTIATSPKATDICITLVVLVVLIVLTVLVVIVETTLSLLNSVKSKVEGMLP